MSSKGSPSRARAMIARVPWLGPSAVRVARRLRHRPGIGLPLVEGYPRRFRLLDDPPAVPEAWPRPPIVDQPMELLSSAARAPAPEPRFDVELFEALNKEYADRPLVATPLPYDDDALLERAHTRLLNVHRSIDLAGKRVLEFGCGVGYEIWSLSHQFGSQGWGIDIVERRAWASLTDDRTRFVCADLAMDRPFEPDFFDRVVSFAVFEHVDHPYATLTEIYRVMKPGGLAWIYANLHRGPMASHAYRWVNFPFPHLLFDDEVFREYCRRHGLPEGGASWVNRLTWSEYERHFQRIGFRIRALRFSERPLDEEFYRRFEGTLGRYPRTDLTRDFFEVVLEKPRRSWRGTKSRKGPSRSNRPQ